MQQPNASIQFVKYRHGQWEATDTNVIVETTVSLAVNGQYWLTFLCTPTDLDALAVGFLYNEGIISRHDEVVAVDVCAHGDSIDVWLNHAVEKPEDWKRTTGCSGGLTSVQSPFNLPKLASDLAVPPEQIGALMGAFLERQDLYRLTRGVHSSALSNGPSIRIQAEDIGRHNTLDKIAGQMLLSGEEVSDKILLTTGRISSEMLQKSARIGASIVVSRTAANNTSIRLAEELGITLIGYARRAEFSIYSHPERITGAPIPVKNAAPPVRKRIERTV